jgi:hypothetical protein
MTTASENLSGDALVSAFHSGQFEIDCLEMRLTQRKQENPIVFSGPGFIRLSGDGNLEFKIYAREVLNTSALASLDDQMNGISGQIYSDGDFYTLAALDRANNQWQADYLIPQVSWPGFQSQTPVVHGELRTLRAHGIFANPTRKHLLRLHFFEELDLAYTHIGSEESSTGLVLHRDRAGFSALGCDFWVTKADSQTIVQAQSDDPFAPYFETRAIEALQFMLARSLVLRVMVRAEGTTKHELEFASDVAKSGRAKLDPPLARGYQGFYECFWPLFTCYLKYVVENNDTRYWHSCSYHLNNACEASTHSVDTWATAVCVAVEGISSLIDVKQTKEEKKANKAVIKAVSEFIDSQELDQNLTTRLKGLLGQLNNVRVGDRLERLRVIGHVSAEHRKAWSDLRNRQAHPKHSDPRDINMADLQQTLDWIGKTTVLMYHIVFHLIGYSGKYVDYGTRRYPVRAYPLPVPQDAPALKEPEGSKSPFASFCSVIWKPIVWVKRSLRASRIFANARAWLASILSSWPQLRPSALRPRNYSNFANGFDAKQRNATRGSLMVYTLTEPMDRVIAKDYLSKMEASSKYPIAGGELSGSGARRSSASSSTWRPSERC